MAGLDNWLLLLADGLDEALRARFQGRRGRWAALGFPGEDGADDAAITISLIALRPASTARAFPPRRGTGGAATEAALMLDAAVLVSARPGPAGYAEALRALSAAMEWLHGNPRLGVAGTEEIGIEFLDLSFDQTLRFAEACSAQGFPSAVYQVRGMSIRT